MNELQLLETIKQAEQDRCTELNLAVYLLTRVPSELGKLTNLKSLDLSFNRLTSVPAELGELTNLKTLDLRDNRLTNFPRELGKLTKLMTLDLSTNKLTIVLPELGKLANLKTLNLSDNRLTAFPRELGKLTSLTTLDLRNNQIKSIPAELGKLTNLTTLDLRNNQIRSIPAELGKLTNLTTLELDDNPLTNPPIEVIRQGVDAVRQWFESLIAEGEKKLNEVKVLLVGYGGAGKTSLVRRLTNGKFQSDEVKTHGVRITRWPITVDGEEVTVHLWDYGGQGIMQATHRVFFSHRSLYVLVIDARQELDSEEWLSNIESLGGNSPVLVVVNKIDANMFGLNETDLKRKYPNIKGFYHVSCREGDGINRFKRELKDHLDNVEMIQMTWPKRHAAVKERLARLRRDIIRYSDYEAICRNEGVHDPEKQKQLITVLHELGVMLHFPDRHLQDTQVLNPEWVTGGIYKLINSPMLKKVKGKLPRDRLDYVLNQERLPDEKKGLLRKRRKYSLQEQTYIVELMNKFGLCSELGEHTILVPDLLTELEPSESLPKAANVCFYFEYDYLPALILPRFMVESCDDLVPENCWRTGAFLKNDSFDAMAVVRQDTRRRRISVEVSSDRPREYLATIRKTILAINESFQKLNVTEWVPLPGQKHHSVKYRDLIGHELGGQREKFVGELGRSFSVARLLGNIESPEETEQQKQQLLRDGVIYVDKRVGEFKGDFKMVHNSNRTSINKVKGSLIVGRHVQTGDITVIKQNIDNSTILDGEVKTTLREAVDALEKMDLSKGDKRDAKYHFDQIVEELEKAPPEPSRLKKLWHYFKKNAPGIAAILQGIDLIAKSLPK